jgi:hypothetical protein
MRRTGSQDKEANSQKSLIPTVHASSYDAFGDNPNENTQFMRQAVANSWHLIAGPAEQESGADWQLSRGTT